MTRARTARRGLVAAMAVLAIGIPAAIAAPGDLTLVSVSSGGAQGTTPAEAAAVSADGRFVAFTSASALTGTATGGKVQLYVRDRRSGTTVLASSSAGGAAADQDVDQQDVDNVLFAISGDGRYVVFASTATNLTAADTDANQDVFRKDLTTGAVTLISVNSAGQKANAGVFGDPDVSGDGNRVSFGSGAATNLFPGDANAATSDIVVRDVSAGQTVLAATSTAGVQANGTTERSAISADGKVISFDAPTGNTTLVPGEGTTNDVIVHNLATGVTAAASDPQAATGGANFSDVSGDGRYVVFETGEPYDATNDKGGNDVYRKDMGTGAIVLISARDGSDVGGNAGGVRPQISADGGRVTFASTSTDLTTDANTATKDVVVRDVGARTTRLASVATNGTTQASTDSLRGAIAANGGLVAFTNDDTGSVPKLIDTDANGTPDVLAKELAPSDTTGPALTLSGPADGATTTADRIAVGGTASDPSGIVSVAAGGTGLSVTAAGNFSASVALSPGANAITVRAVDGAGNATQVTRTVTRTSPTGVTPATKARITRLAALLTKKGAVRVTVKLSAAARVRVSLLRSVVRTKPRKRTVLTSVAAPITRTLTKGTRSIVITPRRAIRPGRYVVRVRILSAAAGPRTRSLVLRVRR